MLPLLATSVLMQSYVFVDGLILGNFINEEALGSVNSVSSIIDICTLVQVAISGGCSISASHLYGAGKNSELKRMIRDFYMIILAVSVGITILAVIGANRILEFINTPDTLMEGATAYLRIVFLGVPFTSLYALQSGALRGMGDSKRPLGGIAISSCVNIGLDLLFIVVLDMGIAGVAVATVAANVLSSAYLHIKLTKRAAGLTDDDDEPRSRVAECIELGLPQIVQSMVTSAGKVMLQNITAMKTDLSSRSLQDRPVQI
ncbi:MAG: polysaccharide biosynthesis C-terminal domain-containing protein [Mogibacterium sp.]|nr:polysaccharide biosynthesis C-terminal domain-containing protein [Mogibacterium sp.]